MSYSITFKKSVFKDLNRLSKKDAKVILDRINLELTQNAERCPALKGQFKGLRKLRIGNYRVIFAIIENDVLILRIAHRKDIYRIN